MDLFSGWASYGSRSGWDVPGYGCYGTRSHPSMRRPNFYDYPNLFYDEPAEWYPSTHFPLHRANKNRSPFERKNRSPFDNNVSVGRPRHPRATIGNDAEQELHDTPYNGQSVTMEKGVEIKKKPSDGVDVNTLREASVSDATSPQPSSTQEVVDCVAINGNTNSDTQREPAETKEHELNTTPPEIKKIEQLMKKTLELERRICAYDGTLNSKDYVFIEESLMTILLQLDNVETNGNLEIRKSRKSAVCSIQQMLTNLEDKAKSNMVTALETGSEQSNDAKPTNAGGEIEEILSSIENLPGESNTEISNSEESEIPDDTSIPVSAMVDDGKTANDVSIEESTPVIFEQSSLVDESDAESSSSELSGITDEPSDQVAAVIGDEETADDGNTEELTSVISKQSSVIATQPSDSHESMDNCITSVVNENESLEKMDYSLNKDLTSTTLNSTL